MAILKHLSHLECRIWLTQLETGFGLHSWKMENSISVNDNVI